MKNAKIIGVGSFLPEKIVTNDDLANIVETSDEWINERTGIRQRRVSDSNTSSSTLAIEAAKRHFKCQNLSPQRLI